MKGEVGWGEGVLPCKLVTRFDQEKGKGFAKAKASIEQGWIPCDLSKEGVEVVTEDWEPDISCLVSI